MDEVLIKVDNVSKKFSRSMRKTIRYKLADISRELLGFQIPSNNLRPAEFWSVDNVSFEIRRGECVGLIGPNGAGKSTLLKMLNGIILPDKGVIEINGRVSALIELGSGFHPMLSGRENIYINGAILGFTKKEIDEKFDTIVEFSEVKDFIDTPVKFYSSGMYTKLGFAIAAQMEPDVLLIDEILAVGDVGFRSKCYRFISEIIKKTAVIFVSHSMNAVARICDRTIVLNKGKCIFIGNTPQGIEKYQALFPAQKSMIAGTDEAQVENIKTLDKSQKETNTFNYGDSLTISFDAKVSPSYNNFIASISIATQQMEILGQCHSSYNNIEIKNDGKQKHFDITIPEILLNPGHYYISLIIFDEANTRHLSWNYAVKKINVLGDFAGSAPMQWRAKWNIQ